MKRLLSRFRRPRAELRIEGEDSTPPDNSTGGVVRLRVELLPLEQLRVGSAWLELALLTTHFARTVLDGYHEHTSETVYQTFSICENVQAQAGAELFYHVDMRLPDVPPYDGSRPARRQWQVRARMVVDGHRPLLAERILRDVSPQGSGAPVVDGRGFLPL